MVRETEFWSSRCFCQEKAIKKKKKKPQHNKHFKLKLWWFQNDQQNLSIYKEEVSAFESPLQIRLMKNHSSGHFWSGYAARLENSRHKWSQWELQLVEYYTVFTTYIFLLQISHFVKQTVNVQIFF